MEEKVRQLLASLRSPLGHLKTDLEDFLGSEAPTSSTYRDTIKSINLARELELDLEKMERQKFNSKKFKQQQLFDENKQ